MIHIRARSEVGDPPIEASAMSRGIVLRNRAVVVLIVFSAVLVVRATNAIAQQFDVVASQLGPSAERGRHPNAGLILASDGNYYGTTSSGGEFGSGTVFKMTPAGEVSIVHSFDNAAGANPRAPVIEGTADGLLYGTTSAGGVGGVGTVFAVAKDGSGFVVLHSLAARDPIAQCFPEGAGINAPLVQGSDGLYGVVASGGCPPNTNAAFFRIDPAGTERFRIVGYVPDTGADSGLVRGADGFFYGTTLGRGFGEIYRIGEGGGSAESLYELKREDGFGHDLMEMVQATDGKLYGTASSGGRSDCGFDNCGTVFQFDPVTREYRTMHSFGLNDPAGRYPLAGLVEGQDGLLYGSTAVTTPSGADCCGTLFSINPLTDEVRVLHTFTGDSLGAQPRGRLIEPTRGQFLGTTYWGGIGGDGVVFRFTADHTTSTSVEVSPASSVFGQEVTLTATVSSTGGVVTGLVEFFDGETSLAVMGLSGGQAVFAISTLNVGSHRITASYLGNGAFTPSESPAVTVTVSPSPTATTLHSSVTAGVFGERVSFRATVASLTGTPTGSVEFFDGTISLGTAALSGGEALVSTAALGVGSHSISATYLGDGSFLQSRSAAVSVNVSNANTTTMLTSSANPSARKQQVTLTAIVAALPPSGAIPQGEVQLMDGKKKLGTAALVNGVATFQIAFNNVGDHQLTAIYTGDGNFAGSSSAMTQTVSR